MLRHLKFLLPVLIALTVVADDKNEARYRHQYEQTVEALPKIGKTLNLGLPASKTPYTDFVKANEHFYDKNLLTIRWVTGSTLQGLGCAQTSAKDETTPLTPQQLENEVLSLKVGQDGLRNFDVSKFVEHVPGYKDCGLRTAETAAIFDYTNSFYKTLNSALRKGSTTKDMNAFVETLDRALHKLANHEGWVRRGTDFSEKIRAKYFRGAIVSDLAYTSSTLSRQFSGDDQLHLFSKTGKYIAPLSANHSEEEVLFLRSTEFEVVAVWVDPIDRHVRHYKLIEK